MDGDDEDKNKSTEDELYLDPGTCNLHNEENTTLEQQTNTIVHSENLEIDKTENGKVTKKAGGGGTDDNESFRTLDLENDEDLHNFITCQSSLEIPYADEGEDSLKSSSVDGIQPTECDSICDIISTSFNDSILDNSSKNFKSIKLLDNDLYGLKSSQQQKQQLLQQTSPCSSIYTIDDNISPCSSSGGNCSGVRRKAKLNNGTGSGDLPVNGTKKK